MNRRGISACGAYIPALRMDRNAMAQAHAWSMPALRSLGKGTRSFCSWDEDSITMAVEALRACLGGSDTDSIGTLTFASTTAPFADLQNASLVARAANLPAQTRTQDNAGAIRAGVSALIATLECSETNDSLVVAADHRKARPGSAQEMHYGAGAAALRVGSGDDVIAYCLGTRSSNNAFIDHYRPADSDHDYYWEERWIRDEGFTKVVPSVVKPLLEQADVAAEDIAYFCMPGYMPRLGGTLAKRLGIPGEAVVDNFAAKIGDTGTPQPLLMLASALERAQPGDKLLVIGFGAGCDAVLLEATEAIRDYHTSRGPTDLSTPLPPVEHYKKFLAFQGDLDLDWGIRSETDTRVALSQVYRAQDQLNGFNAGVCPACDAVQFPVLSTCVNCGATEPMAKKPLADEPAKVHTFTSDGLQYYPAPPMYWGLVQFDNGARLLMEMIEVDPDNFDTGSSLRMVYRIKQRDDRRGLHRYFWKAVPAERGDDNG